MNIDFSQGFVDLAGKPVDLGNADGEGALMCGHLAMKVGQRGFDSI